jgi:hypothetical protein
MNSTKRCTKCQEEKPATLEFFSKHSGQKDGLNYCCKLCGNKRGKKYRENNKEKIAENNRRWNEKNRKEYSKQYRKDNLEKCLKREAESCERRREQGYFKKYHEDNKEKRNKQIREHYQKNKEAILAHKKEYKRNKYRTDPAYRVKVNLRGRFNRALKRNTKSASVLTLIGCSIQELQAYLGEKFTDGMTWENYGEWHIDHIKPCASFDLSDPKQQQECFHYTNLQPLWAEDNLKKGDKTL